ncbi:MAG: c-type cytochrome [Sulfurifustis sp.]
MKRWFALSTVLVVVIVVGISGFFLLGFYDVGATRSHSRPANWTMHTVMRQSVRRHAADVPAPPAKSAATLREGAQHYREMCVECHGAPGMSAGDVGKGLMPPAPDLAKTATSWSRQELFWIIKNGVRFTGMPAWGESADDEEIWALAAFVETLPQLDPEQYRAMAVEKNSAPHTHRH